MFRLCKNATLPGMALTERDGRGGCPGITSAPEKDVRYTDALV